MTRRPTLWRAIGLTLKPLYRACDLDGLPHLDTLPGQAPFARGPYASMYTGKPWTIRQYSGFADASQSNARLRQSMAEGSQGLSIAFDLPTQLGRDSDDPRASFDVGMAGVAIDSVEDMAELFHGIALDRVSVSMTINGAVLPVLAAFIVAARERGIAAAQLSGTVQNDILKEFMVRNTFVFKPEPSLRICTDVIEYLALHSPRFNPISVSGYHFQEAGADGVQELALTLINARTYAEHVTRRGLDLDAFCGRLSFFFGVGNDLYGEIAKLRAARLLWCEMAEGLGVRSSSAKAMRMHCQTSGLSLTAQDPLNNMTRTTVQALAAVFGGTQSLHTNAWDEALALPSAASSRLARDTQRILQAETGVCDVIDPWAGSYLMESLTATLCTQVRDCIARIDAQGGVIAGLQSGAISAMIQASALAAQARLDSGEQQRVGACTATCSTVQQPVAPAVNTERVRDRQQHRLTQLRRNRDASRVNAALQALTLAASAGRGNLLALTVDAVAARATVGECTAALERVWPRHEPLPSWSKGVYGPRRAEHGSWQSLVERVEGFTHLHRRAPHAVLAKLGLDGHDRGLRLIASALGDAGFAVTLLPLFLTCEQWLEHLLAAPMPDLLGFSSLAGAHQQVLAALTPHLDRLSRPVPRVLGGIIPPADHPALTHMGIEAIFGPGDDVVQILTRCLELVEGAVAERLRPNSIPGHQLIQLPPSTL